MRWVSYAWSVIVNCFYIFVILFVFDRLGSRNDLVIVVSILGLIYVTIRSIGIGLAIFSLEGSFIVIRKMNRILANQGDPNLESDLQDIEEGEKIKKHKIIKIYIDGAFLSIISLLCLVALFSSLPSK